MLFDNTINPFKTLMTPFDLMQVGVLSLSLLLDALSEHGSSSHVFGCVGLWNLLDLIYLLIIVIRVVQ